MRPTPTLRSLTLGALLGATAQPLVAELRTVRSITCTNAGLTRYVHLREDRGGLPCDVLYAKPDEDGTIRTEWRARNEPGYCARKYEAFAEHLETELGWDCLIPLGPPTGPVPTPRTTAGASENEGVRERRILDGGRVRIVYADGTVREAWDGGSDTVRPDGTRQSDRSSQAPVPLPPPAPPGSVNERWLASVSERLLSVIRRLVDYDDPSIEAYLRSEPSVSDYARVDARAKTIVRLTR